ncbi:hypothetical protein XH86_25235 [Bradyrhizobium guangdongense]|uniref:Uncharacterized protein n=2 Tax=Bradyrhizobium guangdongense TaxID=1325090 RepID=A0A7S7V7T4_9BRAD|nr:hypothetical protein XH86_25235 [Bradyrhizobium guangdongense]
MFPCATRRAMSCAIRDGWVQVLALSDRDILPLFCPTRQQKFEKYEIGLAAKALATVHGVVFQFLV